MGAWRWAYVDCTATGGQAAGPTGSLQYLTGSNATSGSGNLLYHTAAYGPYAASTMVLTGTLVVSGTISASHYHVESVTVIDSTGSTYFGNTTDDQHHRTGSFSLWSGGGSTAPYLSASAQSKQTFVKGFGGNYTATNAATYTLLTSDYLVGCTNAGANQVIIVPSGSDFKAGSVLVIKDEVSRPGFKITLTTSAGGDPSTEATHYIDGASSYILTGTMPAISLYSNGTSWFVF